MDNSVLRASQYKEVIKELLSRLEGKTIGKKQEQIVSSVNGLSIVFNVDEETIKSETKASSYTDFIVTYLTENTLRVADEMYEKNHNEIDGFVRFTKDNNNPKYLSLSI